MSELLAPAKQSATYLARRRPQVDDSDFAEIQFRKAFVDLSVALFDALGHEAQEIWCHETDRIGDITPFEGIVVHVVENGTAFQVFATCNGGNYNLYTKATENVTEFVAWLRGRQS